ncbi:MAG: hypothetical protein A3C35_02565 [Omnitrophica bacterium RIFCSPHIGHO2_02_FULL_46_11]|nr:MAG: hypothetical protein A3C35_02565 [Omnitrophica bacterium RIFCSPHIGHO2_02_FULL_46_11]
MAIRCPKCGVQHDVVKFEEGKQFECRCGFKLNLSLIETAEDFLRFCEGAEEHKKAGEIQRDAQAICQMILDLAYSDVDIEIAKEHLEEKVKNLFPDKMETYRMIYESRFKRLWDQFRTLGEF